jgi:hypothetical protein
MGKGIRMALDVGKAGGIAGDRQGATGAPAPPRVADHYLYWSNPPPSASPRCLYWVQRFEDGWRGNRRTGGFGYDEAAEYFGVYIWEYLNVLYPIMAEWE